MKLELSVIKAQTGRATTLSMSHASHPRTENRTDHSPHLRTSCVLVLGPWVKLNRDSDDYVSFFFFFFSPS